MSTSKLSEETRKLQFTGGSTFIISLPKKWIEDNRLIKGSTIRLREEEDGLLSILPTEKALPEKRNEAIIKVSIKDKPEEVIRKTISAYLIGYNLIHIRSESTKQLGSAHRQIIKNFSRRMLVGTEIVKDTVQELVLQVLLSYPEFSIQSVLRRMSIITASMHRDAVEALKTLDYQQAKEVISSDCEVDRFNLYSIRQIKTVILNPRIIKGIGLENALDCLGYRLVTRSVERTADHAANIAENVLSLNCCLDEELLGKIEAMSNVAISMFETSIESLFRRDYALAESIIEKIEIVKKSEHEAIILSRKMNDEKTGFLMLIIESIRRTAEYASDISEIVLNLNIESTLK